ncbi:hypothetical protein [Halorubrum ezzemoulense]|uniref:Uncharacterized protein n=1 Tax=Halorubrum ezzemoulense TaxID=337243 RepID=A0A256JHS3_HALEZ|nr:hypothetical protein [Halorubrum ezzemoulense]OYR68153.1 hypothetical protein DJ78_14555 [Halorubrum ezzemoulense]
MSDDHELTLTATGTVRTESVTEADDMTVTQAVVQEVTAEIPIDGDRLYNSDVATTHRQGSVITRADVADVVCEEIDAEPVDVDEWELTLSASLDDWQKVTLDAADKRRMNTENKIATAIEILLSLHEDFGESDRPILAALNIDETYDHGRSDDLISELDSVGHVLQAKADEEVTADA